MELPNLPTDNLYKFTFMAGLFIIIFGLTIFTTQYKGISDKIDTLDMATKKYEIESKLLSEDIKRVDQQLNTFEQHYKIRNNEIDSLDIVSDIVSLKKRLKSKSFREYYSFLLLHKNDLTPYIEKSMEIKIMVGKSDSLERKLRLTDGYIEVSISTLKNQINILRGISIFTIIALVSGVTISVKAYKKWEVLVQTPLDKKLNLEIEQLNSAANDK